MINLLSSHLEDCSTSQYFCFAIRCEVCGEFWYSSSIPFSKAAQEADYAEKKEPFTRGKRNRRNWLRERRPESGSVCARFAGDWFVIPVSLFVMKWICAVSAQSE